MVSNSHTATIMFLISKLMSYSSLVNKVLTGTVIGTVVGGILALASSANAATVVGYVEVGPNDCQIEYLATDNEIYTFWEDCDEN